MPLNFSLAFNDGTNDVDDATGDVARVGTFGSMWFEPALKDGARLASSDGATCPRLFSGFIENGVLKTEAGGATNIRLWANDPAWGISRFPYRVRADLTDAQGRAVPWQVLTFNAPDVDDLVDLKDHMPRLGFGLMSVSFGGDLDGGSSAGNGLSDLDGGGA